jgi:mono/diheme cytochrome c family protein/glucose/arabinose dehydrogenase
MVHRVVQSLRWATSVVVAIGLSFFVATIANAEDEDDDLPALRSGLIARYTGSDGITHVRRDEALQFNWHTRRPDPRLPVGPFSVDWNGSLFTISPGKYTLHVFAIGQVQVRLAGRLLLDTRADDARWLQTEPIELEYAYHPIEVKYRRSGREAQIGLFWSGPQFQLEPVPDRHLFHEPRDAPDERFEEGLALARALRCAACHAVPGEPQAMAGPALTHLMGNLSPPWVIDWLRAAHRPSDPKDDEELPGRMPAFGFSADESAAIADALFASSAQAPNAVVAPTGEVESGHKLFLTIGCLACHTIEDREQGTGNREEVVAQETADLKRGRRKGSELLGGGDLSAVAVKRPPDFFARWLESPAQVNPAHRMPVFTLAPKERDDLAAYLVTLRGERGVTSSNRQDQEYVPQSSKKGIELGRRLIADSRCGACHELPRALTSAPVERRPLGKATAWSNGCLGEPHHEMRRPGYGLATGDRESLRSYFESVVPAAAAETTEKGKRRRGEKGAVSTDSLPSAENAPDGRQLMIEHNCLGCHARGLSNGVAGHFDELVAAHPELAPSLAALVPPPLTGAGDKLRDDALAAAISRTNPPLRPWLAVRMPKFRLANDELRALAEYFIESDRIPERPIEDDDASDEAVVAGGRLVTSEGFGCTSCHQIGKSSPVAVAPAAHGADLSLVGARVRRAWFDRWVRNPARIVPRMEMPSIQLPVRGVLDDKLNDQLSAVWRALNTPGFNPPPPGAIRVLRTNNVPRSSGDIEESAVLLTDVLEIDERQFVVPLVVGLANRHNLLFDLGANQLAGWWLGDTARQRTRGKNWFWQPGGSHVLPPLTPDGESELELLRRGESSKPLPSPQFAAQLDWFERVRGGLRFGYRSRFDSGEAEPLVVSVAQQFTVLDTAANSSGFRRRVELRGPPSSDKVAFRLVFGGPFTLAKDARSAVAASLPGQPRVRLIAPQDVALTLDSHAGHTGSTPVVVLESAGPTEPLVVEADYLIELAADRFPPVRQDDDAGKPAPLAVVPGYETLRLPLPTSEMPTGLAWRGDGTLAFCSLKGSVWLAYDTDGDGIEDRQALFCDGLAAPYGLAANGQSLDVAQKPNLLRLTDYDRDGRADRGDVVASGWGYTADYHDWTVGLPRDSQGAYYVGLPCQQDDRNEAAAYLRGTVVKLEPRRTTADGLRPYALVPLAAGLRFPMGLALNRADELFVTDNQGNYTPFNELNQIVAGARYGFINRNEVRPGFAPPFREPAIDIPHPWTRSINGICFLDDGPFAGHLIGCEYDTRRLVRMSLQRVGEDFQGAAYPFSIEPAEGLATFEGPVVCAVAPDGDLYVGNVRDSGWGGGNNTGSIVRLRPSGSLPCGIREVRATNDGFAIDFTQPIDREAVGRLRSYAIESYRRIPSSAYGSPDVDREVERIESLDVAADGRGVTLRTARMRRGYVYEIRMSHIGPANQRFFPAEAYYTLRSIP